MHDTVFLLAFQYYCSDGETSAIVWIVLQLQTTCRKPNETSQFTVYRVEWDVKVYRVEWDVTVYQGNTVSIFTKGKSNERPPDPPCGDSHMGRIEYA